ncbi:MAG: alpha/beta hydrolase [Chloroflexota bacterium]
MLAEKDSLIKNGIMLNLSKILRPLLFVISGFLLITAFPLAVWLLFNFLTVQGFILALLGIFGPLWGMWLYFASGRKTFKRVNQIAGGLITIGAIVLVILTPSGRATDDETLRHMYNNGGRFVRLSPFNVIPEIEQMNVGINLIGPADPFIDRAKADRLSDLTLSIYADMEQDSEFKQAGSVMGLPIRQPFRLPFDNGHYYLYVPQSADLSEPLPVLVFLHGAGGPFKAYQWVWRDFAEENGFVVISPTYGFGVWPEQEGTTAVMRAIDHAAEHSGVTLDQDQLWLAGLSMGGHGTIYTGTQHPDRFQGLILISAGMPSEIMFEENGPFNSTWRNRPVLLIHGEQDLRMPMDYLNQHIGFMETGGIDLDTKLYPAEDHFLFFAQKDELMSLIAAWINAQQIATNSAGHSLATYTDMKIFG